MTPAASGGATAAPTRGDLTRSAMVAAATRLFAAQGIDGPSLREITRVAGQRNTGALQYHFGDRDALLVAVVGRRADVVEAERLHLLDRSDGSLRSLAGVLAKPYVARLSDEDGPAWLQVVREVWAQPTRFPSLVKPDASISRWSAAVAPYLPDRASGRPLHRRYAAIRFVLSEVADRGRLGRSDHRLFASHLVDMTSALLSAPVSDETKALIR